MKLRFAAVLMAAGVFFFCQGAFAMTSQAVSGADVSASPDGDTDLGKGFSLGFEAASAIAGDGSAVGFGRNAGADPSIVLSFTEPLDETTSATVSLSARYDAENPAEQDGYAVMVRIRHKF